VGFVPEETLLWETTDELTCPLCQQDFDTKGDHLFQCHQIGRKVNTKMHNKWRDTWQSHLNTLMPLLKLTNTKALKEQTGLIRGLRGSKLRPFDTHVNLPPISTDNHYRCKLQSIGFDMVLCNSDTCPPPSRGGTDAKSNNIITSLLTAEKNKFQRGKSTNKASTCSRTGITLSGDQIIGELYNSKKQLIPFAISPLGLFGPTINSFLYGTDPPTTQPHNISEKHFPHAYNMAKRAFSKEVPSDILQTPQQILWSLLQKPRPPHLLHTTIRQRSLPSKRNCRARSNLLTWRRPKVQVVITQQQLPR
jgi:hypothetical protein